jgi:hopanoid biosynthesis associated RND transporter like protein HpnN
MESRPEDRFSRSLGRWVGFVGRHAFAVILLAMGLAATALDYAANHLGIHGATEQLFARDLPFKQSERRYREAFPAQYENMFVVVDAATPERAGEAATALLAGMQAEPRYFHTAYLPGGGDFFEEHAFLYLETDELEDLADSLAENQPYLAELSRDGSLRGLTNLMTRGVRACREGDVKGSRLQPMLIHFSAALAALAAGEPYNLSWAEVLAGGRIDRNATRRFLLVQPVLDFSDLQPAKQPILAVRRIAKERGLDSTTGVRVRITGDAALSYEELNAVRKQAAVAGTASFVLVGLILTFAFRSIRLVAATLATLVAGLIYTAGFTAVAIGHFNLISVAFAVLFIGLGVDFAIHYCIRYRELLVARFGHADALERAARDVGGSIALCAVTTAIGFFAFVPTDFVGVAELGLISGAGMFISLICTLTLLPALMSVAPTPASHGKAIGIWKARRAQQRTPPLTSIPLRYPQAVRASALVLGGVAIFLLPQARFDNNPLNVRDPSSESVRTFNDLLEKGGALPWSVNAIVPNLTAAEAIADELRSLDVVGRVVTVASYIPTDQEEKLGIIEDVAMFLAPPTGVAGAAAVAPLDAQAAALENLESEIEKLMEERPSAELGNVARDLHRELRRFTAKLAASDDPGRALRTLEAGLVASLPEQLRILTAALGAGRVTLENLPGALLERMVTADGRARIQIFPRGAFEEQAEMAAFVEGVRSVTPEIAGSAAEVVESSRAVVRALRQALLSAVVAITLFLLLLWRRVNDTALVLFPLGLAATLTVAAAVLLDIPFNFADVIVLPLLLGIGVDSGIHLVHRARLSGPGEPNLLATSTARAVAYSALTTIASFGTMGLASHLGLATLGRLLTIGVGITVVCNLVVLPALIVLHAPKQRGAEQRRRAA